MSKKSSEPAATKGRTLDISASEPSATHDGAIAKAVVAGIATNATTVTTFSKGTLGEVDLTETFRALQAGGRTVQSGDLSGVEAMLLSQMVALNTIFGELARRSALNMGEYIESADRYMRLALRAQSQCRTTAETLALIKQGPPVFARQANIAHGPQQVNNAAVRVPSRQAVPRADFSSQQPELMEAQIAAETAGRSGRDGEMPVLRQDVPEHPLASQALQHRAPCDDEPHAADSKGSPRPNPVAARMDH